MKWNLVFGIALLVLFSSESGAQVRQLDLPPPEATASENYILIVRHAYPACGDVQCDLNPEGYNQARELALFISNIAAGGLPLTAVLASGTCRTVLTVTPAANEAGLPVNGYVPRAGLESCHYPGDGDTLIRPANSERPDQGLQNSFHGMDKREDIIAALDQEADQPAGQAAKFYLVADHSNYVCAWFRQLGVPEEEYRDECLDGDLVITDYADFYWLYDAKPGEGREWHLSHFENAFDRSIPNAYEK